MRMIAASVVIAGLSVAGAYAAGAAPTGVYTEDIDRKAQPCTDFFEFANGAWREQNPIPASMVRWSRRWASGELAKDQLKVILDEVSAKPTWPARQRRAAHRRLLRRLHGRGRASTRRASSRSQPLLAEIDAIKDAAGVQAMIGRLHDLAIDVPVRRRVRARQPRARPR